jgi:hypothetical protein
MVVNVPASFIAQAKTPPRYKVIYAILTRDCYSSNIEFQVLHHPIRYRYRCPVCRYCTKFFLDRYMNKLLCCISFFCSRYPPSNTGTRYQPTLSTFSPRPFLHSLNMNDNLTWFCRYPPSNPRYQPTLSTFSPRHQETNSSTSSRLSKASNGSLGTYGMFCSFPSNI